MMNIDRSSQSTPAPSSHLLFGLQDLVREVRAVVIGSGNRDKPLVIAITGAPGSGKTAAAEAIAGNTALKLVMADCSHADAVQTMLGARRGFVGSDRWGRLTDYLRNHPNGCIVLDEFEKAHPEVQSAILNVWTEGVAIERSSGDAVSSARSTFILPVHSLNNLTADIRAAVSRTFAVPALSARDQAQLILAQIERSASTYRVHVDLHDPALIEILEKLLGTHGLITFADLQRKLHRKADDLFLQAAQQGRESAVVTAADLGLSH
ncbi:AAA family ATPase [Bosea beijingensis]|uniref:AAA family ATPase n=1 Tax=Bosea beijingensis TaxID=3068632 RepID=UPI00274037CD|nr:AAA family ATPase [Bosea sp. REN20]